MVTFKHFSSYFCDAPFQSKQIVLDLGLLKSIGDGRDLLITDSN